uniref:RNase H type-1 domain-containing protein n=1 Tax=Glycine max TaxID=3847 RepID=A0A0R0EGB1_SOYBN
MALGKNSVMQVGCEVIQGEALGFLHALFGALQLGLPSVIFELDCKLVVDWVLTGIDDVSKVKFVRRQANVMAHVLARAFVGYASFTLFNSMSSFIS